MPRDMTTITRSQLLDRVREAAGADSEQAATRLLDLAREIGAEEVPAHRSISIRLPVPETDYSGWLTLYVVSEAATIYVNWLERWADAGASPSLAVEYERDLRSTLGVRKIEFHPARYRGAVPLEIVAKHIDGVCDLIRATAADLMQQTKLTTLTE